MLERLNGDEKGDAIVSVRGYEPIWTVFTPSYELKKVYFPEGKAAIGKREAVLFEKENYVFDITGDIGQKIEDISRFNSSAFNILYFNKISFFILKTPI